MGGMLESGLDYASGFEGVTDFTSQLDFSSLQEEISNVSDVCGDLDRFTRRRTNLNVRQVGRQGRVLSPPPQAMLMSSPQIQTVVPAQTVIQGPGPIQLSPGVPIQTVIQVPSPAQVPPQMMIQGPGPVQVPSGVPPQMMIQGPGSVQVPPGVPPQMMVQGPGPVQVPPGVPPQMIIQGPGPVQVPSGVPPQMMIQGPGPANLQPSVSRQMEAIQGASPAQVQQVVPEVQTVAVHPSQTVQATPTVQASQPGIQQGQVVQGPQAIYQPTQTVVITQPQRTVVASGTKPPDAHTCLAWSSLIISLFACCWPFGLVSVVFAQRAGVANSRRNYHKAASAGKQAKTFAIVAIVLTCITFTILIVLIIIGSINNSSSSYSSNDSGYNDSY